uniref:Uncharacterized protein n=1 Tax=Anguilla anguilla TaxID=7936 RepID=A0A0E9QSF0_ANGAN
MKSLGKTIHCFVKILFNAIRPRSEENGIMHSAGRIVSFVEVHSIKLVHI